MYCNICEEEITQAEYTFSKTKFNTPLCRKHQRELEERITPQAWEIGQSLRKLGWNIKYELSDGCKHIDIAVPEVKMNIEVDGKQHVFDKRQALADLKRTYHSFKNGGYLTLRIPNILTQDKEILYETVKYIHRFLKESGESLEYDD